MRQTWWLSVALVLLLVAGGCSSEDGGGVPEAADGSMPADGSSQGETGTESCDPAAETTPGETVEALQSGGVTREYRLDVPTGYDGSTPVPLFVDFHGFGSSSERQDEYSALDEAAAEVDGIVATPQGLGGGAWGFAPDSTDLTFLSELITELQARLCIDPTRVASTGISNGSALSATAACVLSDQLSAVGLVAATVPPLGCTPEARTSVIAFHGTADPVAAYEGRPADDLVGAEDGIRAWAGQDGCQGEPTVEDVAADVVHWTWSDCGGDTAVDFYAVQGAGHVWPGAPEAPDARDDQQNTDSISASQLIVEFVMAHPRSG
jgi:polyhydroxybutyrate depolymerase